jgi:hypothetical protein
MFARSLFLATFAIAVGTASAQADMINLPDGAHHYPSPAEFTMLGESCDGEPTPEARLSCRKGVEDLQSLWDKAVEWRKIAAGFEILEDDGEAADAMGKAAQHVQAATAWYGKLEERFPSIKP